ncbi:hypothetical protein M408DRAFT_241728 [Serendipita vermifera MAFF 305830]|uniref:DASH complex subunit ASK1 n=1 Tax=Serendipita vermifera MAFF 305830 TaxID=933852 RepID=A0A0C3B580_SERVB|nr:hypothetical protein M408DRAFT_241728 [Serendipita vermifera MAFF 305830]
MLPADQTRLRDKYSLAFRPPSPPLPLQWREMTDDEIMALDIPGVDPNAPPTLHADQVDMAICEKLREIDNNMAAVHSVLAYQILPGLKEYARVTEPIREVSRFWISMFEAACAPKGEHDVNNEGSPAPIHDSGTTTPTAASSSRTPIITSESRTGVNTSSEEPSFQAFSHSDGQDGLMTSTPVAHRAKKQSNQIFSSKGESSESSTTDESPHTRMRRQMEALQMNASLDMSETSASTVPISPSTVSASSLSSFRPQGPKRFIMWLLVPCRRRMAPCSQNAPPSLVVTLACSALPIIHPP